MTATETKRNIYLRENHYALWLAINVHRNHKNIPLTFVDRPYLRQIYIDQSPYMVVIKSTQCGISEYLWLKTVEKAHAGRNVFYVLPTIILKNQFVRDRIDRSITFTRHYRRLVQQGESESMSLKHIGKGGVAFVGSNSAASFTSYAADDSIEDEIDQCDQGNLAMTPERLSNQDFPTRTKVSNPTIEGYGIDEEFKLTDKKEWYVQCGCGERICPDFFRDVLRKDGEDWVILDTEWDRDSTRDIRPICPHCGRPYNRFGEGEWVATERSDRSGYHISKLFSTSASLVELVDRFEAGLTNDTKMQRFYNGDLGVAFTAAGSKVSRTMLADAIEDYNAPTDSEGPCVMGVDVGATFLHCRISKILEDGRLQSVYIGTARTYTDVRDLYRRYKVRMGVIDANPERRLSQKICATLKGFWMCFYGKTKREFIDPRQKILTVPRTPALDAVKEYIQLKTIVYPKNALSVEDFEDQMTASTRVWKEDREEYVWEEGSRADHYFHAEAYMVLAKKLLIAAANRR